LSFDHGLDHTDEALEELVGRLLGAAITTVNVVIEENPAPLSA
jgi:hypothetical protein